MTKSKLDVDISQEKAYKKIKSGSPSGGLALFGFNRKVWETGTLGSKQQEAEYPNRWVREEQTPLFYCFPFTLSLE